jgi:hypothetical protein
MVTRLVAVEMLGQCRSDPGLALLPDALEQLFADRFASAISQHNTQPYPRSEQEIAAPFLKLATGDWAVIECLIP